MRLGLFICFFVALFMAASPLFADDQNCEVITVGSDKFLRWHGHAGRTYFIQISDPNDHLANWTWAPCIEIGNDEIISYEVDSTADRGFFRLHYTDEPTNDPDFDDFDDDGLTNWAEVQSYQTNPLDPDTDGDSIPDGWEIFHSLDPLNFLDRFLDFDNDGISNLDEFLIGTYPTIADTDGDGVSDGDEIAQGTDPVSATSFIFQWHRVTRNLEYNYNDYPPPNNTGSVNNRSAWDSTIDTFEVLTETIPFPNLKARLEIITFPASPPAEGGTKGLDSSNGQSDLLPNPPCFHANLLHQRLWLRRAQAETKAFQQRAFIVTERNIDNAPQPLTFESIDVTIPANGTTSGHVDLNKGFTKNFTENAFHSEVFTSHLCPLELRQTNMPNIGVPENSTDLGGQRGERMIGVGGYAYITGEPAVAQLRARFRNMPADISVEWRLEIRTERPAERLALDDMNFPAEDWVTLPGDQEWDITAAMSSECVGGNCTLHYRLNGDNAGSVTFRIRGKNPLDADARARIDASVGAAFQPYAWAMAKHESRQGNRIYNQFNTQQTIEGTLNYGGPNGWGVCQIDRTAAEGGVTTAETWNWHANVGAMNAKLVEKQTTYNRFIGYFRDSYGQQANWSDPPAAHQIGNTTLPAEAWGVMVLYNGTGGVPWLEVPAHNGEFRSPWVFNPTTGVWIFHDNQNQYAGGPTRVRAELENTNPTQE